MFRRRIKLRCPHGVLNILKLISQEYIKMIQTDRKYMPEQNTTNTQLHSYAMLILLSRLFFFQPDSTILYITRVHDI